MATKSIKLDNSQFSAPDSWQIKKQKGCVAARAPEKDLSIYLLEVPVDGQVPLDELATATWKKIDPMFALKAQQQGFIPTTGNWEKSYQIFYETPVSEARIVMGIINAFQNKAYVCLVDAKSSGFSRRVGDLKLIIESWKPVGFRETDLSINEMKKWSALDIQAFENFVHDVMAKSHIPGLAISIVSQDEQFSYQKAFGVKQLHTEDAVTIDTPFMIGSTTKSLTTLMMARALKEKKLSWDNKVTDILKGFELGDKALTSQLTLRHTVSASTGMPRRDFDFIFNYRHLTPEDRLNQMKAMRPTTKLGETFQYSNFLFMVGGYAAARAFSPKNSLENAYNEAMQRCVFDPLNMKNSTVKMQEALRKGAAFPHGADFKGEMREISLGIEEACYSIAPAGAIWSTVVDLTQYLLLEMNNGRLQGKRIINEDELLERRKPSISMGENDSYGLGLMTFKEQGLNIVSHGGATLGFSSDLFFIPNRGIGMVILANARYAHVFLNAIKQKFMEITFSAKPTSEELLALATKEHAESYKQFNLKISIDPKDYPWVQTLVGEYTNAFLGMANLQKAKNHHGYELQCKEWTSRLAFEVDSHHKHILVLIDPPSCGAFKLVVADNGQELILNGGQETYAFVKAKGLLHAKKLHVVKASASANRIDPTDILADRIRSLL